MIKMKIAIISHTLHYFTSDGEIVGWGPTVREINYLSNYFETIYHIACLKKEAAPASALPYVNSNINFISIKPTGGKTILEKLNVITTAPSVISTINRVLADVDAVQLRLPTGIGNYLLPWFTFQKRDYKLWVKYAGAWNMPNPPLGYAFQKWWLNKNFLNAPVTINGKWPNQPNHCYTFENPCLDDDERTIGLNFVNSKTYIGPFESVFIGRMEDGKGVERIINSLEILKNKNVSVVHFIGDGTNKANYESIAHNNSNIKCIFYGGLSRYKIVEILKKCHFLILPSDSEGFPKVIAEGANYGAIPIVSDVSSISQYINAKNGFLWPHNTDFSQWLSSLDFNSVSLKDLALNAHQFAESFTFSSYLFKLKKDVLNDEQP